MADKIVTLHPQGNTSDNLYPRVLGQSVQAGTNISIDSTANTISVAQSLVDTIDGKQTKGDYVLSSALSNYYTSAQTDSLLRDYMKSSDIQTNYALKSSLPTKVSQLTNDSGYLTSPDLKTSVSVVSNSDDTTSLSVSVGGVSSSAKTDTLKVASAYSLLDEQGRMELTYEDIDTGKQDTIPATGSVTKPVYFSAQGTIAEASTYAGGTKVTLNGSDRGGNFADFYAPTSYGTAGYVLTSGEETGVPPKWTNPSSLSVASASYANAIGTSSSNYTKSTLDTALNGKQATLVSGTNLKTINNTSLLGSGNLAISGNVTIGHVDIGYSQTKVDQGLFYEAFTKHKAILGVYFVVEYSDSADYYSCIYNYGYSDTDTTQTTYTAYFQYVPGSGANLQRVPTGSMIRIVYLD